MSTGSKVLAICRYSHLISQGHIHTVNAAQCLLVCVWSLGDMRLVWALGIENRQVVLDRILRLHSDKAKEFLSPVIGAYLSQQGVRQTVNSGYYPAGNGLAERWVGIIKLRATALLADVRLPQQYWSYACRWIAYVHTHRVTEIAIDKTLPNFGDVVVVHQALKKSPSSENRGTTGV